MTTLEEYGTCTLEDDGCTTCGDMAVPVRVIRQEGPQAAVCMDRTGRQAEIRIDFTPGVKRGDVLLVHMGVAIAKVQSGGQAGASA